MHIWCILSVLQSRRDGMFIAARTTSSLSPVGTICFEAHQHKYAVPTELKRRWVTFFYKHIVPTGLKKLPNYFFNLHTGCATKCPFNSKCHYSKSGIGVLSYCFSKNWDLWMCLSKRIISGKILHSHPNVLA